MQKHQAVGLSAVNKGSGSPALVGLSREPGSKTSDWVYNLMLGITWGMRSPGQGSGSAQIASFPKVLGIHPPTAPVLLPL